MKGNIFIQALIVLSVALLGAGTASAQGSRYGSGGLGCPGRQGAMGGMSLGIKDSGPRAGWIKDGGTMRPGYRGPEGAMTKFDAQLSLRNYVTRDPNVQLGSIRDKGDSFEADVIGRDRSLVGRVTVEKDTGWIRSVY
ncbi:MAG: hypothetical protein ACM3MN_03050 [Nitrospirota bacterium]